jgi:hypothetical protein
VNLKKLLFENTSTQFMKTIFLSACIASWVALSGFQATIQDALPPGGVSGSGTTLPGSNLPATSVTNPSANTITLDPQGTVWEQAIALNKFCAAFKKDKNALVTVIDKKSLSYPNNMRVPSLIALINDPKTTLPARSNDGGFQADVNYCKDCYATFKDYLPEITMIVGGDDNNKSALAHSGLLSAAAASSNLAYAITDIALERAQQDLLTVYAQKWIEALESGGTSKELVKLTPNTWAMLKGATQGSEPPPLSDGAAWKGAFQTDLDNLRYNAPKVVTSLISGDTSLRNTILYLNIALQSYLDNRDPVVALAALASHIHAVKESNKPTTVLYGALISSSILAQSILKPNKVYSDRYGMNSFLSFANASNAEILTFVNLVNDKYNYLLEGTRNTIFTVNSLQQLLATRDYIVRVISKLDAINKKMASVQNFSNTEGKFEAVNDALAGLVDILSYSKEYFTSIRQSGLAGQIDGCLPYADALMHISRGSQQRKYGEVVSGTIQLVDFIRDSVSDNTQAIAKLQSINEFLRKYGMLMADLLMAKDADASKAALKKAIEPLGSWRTKQNTSFAASITTMPGIASGYEWTVASTSNTNYQGGFYAVTLPVGLDVSWSKATGNNCAWSVLVQVLDLGALLNYRPGPQNQVQNTPTVDFRQVLSPGLFLVCHFKKSPIIAGIGYSYSPSLRQIKDNNLVDGANSHRLGLIIGVDVNLFYLAIKKSKGK